MSRAMTPYEFFRLVERMRTAQREYFRTRAAEPLRVSKLLERDVDREIERANRFIRERQNPMLNFNEPNEPDEPNEPATAQKLF